MKPVEQMVEHDPENGRIGDCFAACLASLLELPIDDVPVMPSYDEGWFRPYGKWLIEQGYHWLWLKLEGCYVPGWSIVSGWGPRGVLHSCVARDGEIVWDPYPYASAGDAELMRVRDTLVLLPLVLHGMKVPSVLEGEPPDITYEPGLTLEIRDRSSMYANWHHPLTLWETFRAWLRSKPGLDVSK